ncbi:MAG: VOC family protein [Alphaproteobacteria bacterium]
MSRPRVDHIGVIVTDLGAAIALFEKLFGGAKPHIKELPDVGLRVAEFEAENVTIELLEYTGHNDAFAKQVMGERLGINHVSFGVADLAASIDAVAAAGAVRMAGFPRQGAHGKVAFFDPRSTGGLLFELCQPDGAAPPSPHNEKTP